VDAHRVVRILQRRLGCEQLRHAGFHVAAPACVVGLRPASTQQARRLDAGRHVGELELDRLVLAIGLPKVLRTCAYATDSMSAARATPTPRARDVDATELEPRQHVLHAQALDAADEVVPECGSCRTRARRCRCPCSRAFSSLREWLKPGPSRR
jgi:hypothetical protein